MSLPCYIWVLIVGKCYTWVLIVGNIVVHSRHVCVVSLSRCDCGRFATCDCGHVCVMSVRDVIVGVLQSEIVHMWTTKM